MKDKAEQYFNCTMRDRAIFEAGIKLGTVYHQFVGVPINKDNVEVLEKAIEESIKVQPFVDSVSVKIDRSRLKKSTGPYKYLTLTGNMMDVELTIKYQSIKVICKLNYIAEIDYPLMYISDILEE
ncbi:MAG: dihydroneopterin aldolase family protein [Thermoplasmata archaeon]